MPKEPMKNRVVRVSDRIWDAAKHEADRRSEPLSEVIRRFLADYGRVLPEPLVAGPQPICFLHGVPEGTEVSESDIDVLLIEATKIAGRENRAPIRKTLRCEPATDIIDPYNNIPGITFYKISFDTCMIGWDHWDESGRRAIEVTRHLNDTDLPGGIQRHSVVCSVTTGQTETDARLRAEPELLDVVGKARRIPVSSITYDGHWDPPASLDTPDDITYHRFSIDTVPQDAQ